MPWLTEFAIYFIIVVRKERVNMRSFFPRAPQDIRLDEIIENIALSDDLSSDEWYQLDEDLKECFLSESDAVERLQEQGLTLENASEVAQSGKKDFLNRAKAFHLPLENRFMLCQSLCRQARPGLDELLRLFCEIVCDKGFLLDTDQDERTQEQDALNWLDGQRDANFLYDHLSARFQLSERFAKLLEELKNIKLRNNKPIVSDDPAQYKVFDAYTRLFNVPEHGTYLLDSISWLLQTASCYESLSSIKPLFLYQMLVCHGKRLQKAAFSKINSAALWKYRRYATDKNDSKNYQAYLRNLIFFDKLCLIFQSDERVDLTLCLYAFDHLSNLGDFYREHDELELSFPFDLSMERILDECTFTCFEHGYGDNVIFEDNTLSIEQIEQFQSSTSHHAALEKIAKYMNANAEDLTHRFLNANPDQVKDLCNQILNNSSLSSSQQPHNMTDLIFFLTFINDGLMEAVNYFANCCLIQAGNKFANDEGADSAN